jgi:hypothetical protein
MKISKAKIGFLAAQATILMALATGCAGGGDIGRIESALKQACSNLPSNLSVSGPTTAQEFSQPPRNSIYVARAGGQLMYWWVLDSSSNRLSMTTAYAGDENVAASWGCPADIVSRG